MPWPRAAQRVLVLAAALLALSALLGERAARRPLAVTVTDDPSLELRLDLNGASAVDLETLPGVGAALAEKIVAHRAEHGPFRSVDELLNVPGFGQRLVAALRPYLSVF